VAGRGFFIYYNFYNFATCSGDSIGVSNMYFKNYKACILTSVGIQLLLFKIKITVAAKKRKPNQRITLVVINPVFVQIGFGVGFGQYNSTIVVPPE
jgi:hypothetical protein